jgi:hypothetical protein
MNAIRRLTCVIAAGACAFAGNAVAYTDEAVADAEALLKTTIDRAQRREASTQELSIARYHLLEMKAGSGKLSPEAFCDQARAELQKMATADGDEPVRAEIGLRADKIDIMTTSPEFCRQAIADVDGYLFGGDPPAKTDDEVQEAEKAAEEARRRYKAQDLDRTTATLAEIRGLEAPYAAGKITREIYCASGQGLLLADFANWVQTQAQFGQAGLLGLIAARRSLFQFKALCQTK